MTALVVFLFVHVSVAFAVKGTVLSMITGRLQPKPPRKDGKKK
jgi:cytochrome b subunit of formate dehydrogenase